MEKMTTHLLVMLVTALLVFAIFYFGWGSYMTYSVLMLIVGTYFYLSEKTESKAPPMC